MESAASVTARRGRQRTRLNPTRSLPDALPICLFSSCSEVCAVMVASGGGYCGIVSPLKHGERCVRNSEARSAAHTSEPHSFPPRRSSDLLILELLGGLRGHGGLGR